MNKCNCEGHQGDSHFCPLHGEVIHPDHAEALTMSEKPEKIFVEEKTNCSGLYWTHDSMGLAEYIRADLAKPSEWIERKARAFDWFVAEMMDEELEILMKKGGYKTPLEAIEKAMVSPPRETP